MRAGEGTAGRPGAECPGSRSTHLGPGGHQPLQLLVLVAALKQTDFVSPRLGLGAADPVRQQLRPGHGAGALTGHGPLPPPLPAGPGALWEEKGPSPSEASVGPTLTPRKVQPSSAIGRRGPSRRPPHQPGPSYLRPGPRAPSGRAAPRLAGLSAGRHGLRTQAGRHPLGREARPSRALDEAALGTPTARLAARAPVPHGPAGRGQRHLGEGRRPCGRHGRANPTHGPQAHRCFQSAARQPLRSLLPLTFPISPPACVSLLPCFQFTGTVLSPPLSLVFSWDTSRTCKRKALCVPIHPPSMIINLHLQTLQHVDKNSGCMWISIASLQDALFVVVSNFFLTLF